MKTSEEQSLKNEEDQKVLIQKLKNKIMQEAQEFREEYKPGEDPTEKAENIKQEELMLKYGTPQEFANACYNAVPAFISLEEANLAIQKYLTDWAKAGLDEN